MEQLKDEFSDKPVPCPKCKKLATSVFKTGNKIFYNHGEPRTEYKDGQFHVNWNSCSMARPLPEKKS